MPNITLQFRNTRELQSFIERVATPIAKQEAQKAVDAKWSFRGKKETASATSSYMIGTRNPVGQSGNNISSAGTVTQSTLAINGFPITALQQLLDILDSMGLIKNESTIDPP